MLDELSLTLADLGCFSEGKTEFVIQPKPSRAPEQEAVVGWGLWDQTHHPRQVWEWDPSHAHISCYKRRVFSSKHDNFWGESGVEWVVCSTQTEDLRCCGS